MKRILLALVIAALPVVVLACYKCADPQCSNVPPVDPVYPPDPPMSARDAGPG